MSEAVKNYSAEFYTAVTAVIVTLALGLFAMENRVEPRPTTDFVAPVKTVG